jgi:hypothetical protein
VPDNEDYAELGRLLAHPETWTRSESAYILSLRGSQAEALTEAHPKDAKRIASLQKLLDEIDGAIARWRRVR